MKRSRITPINMHFSKNLKFIREKQGITQTEAALRLDVKVKTYLSWEHGRNEPPFEMLIKIAELYLVDDIYLMLTKQLN